MKTSKNLEIFNSLSEAEFFKDHRRAERRFRNIALFPNALGFDEKSSGFIVLHYKHVDVALPQELPVCLILKKMGYGIILLNEADGHLVADVLIEKQVFEIKRISKAANLQAAITIQFRYAYRKANNLILHIDQPAHPESVRNGIYQATKKYARIKLIWLVYEGN